MKKLFFTALMLSTIFNFSYAQVGINTDSPTNTLHVKNTPGIDPVRIEGLQEGSGAFLLVDDDGVLKASTSKVNMPFVLPTVSNSTGITLSQASETGSNVYTEGSSPIGSIPGGGSWTKIPDMEIEFDIIDENNTISMQVEGISQYNGNMAPGTSVSYAIGIFVDSKLVAVRFQSIDGNNFNIETSKWSVLGQVSNLSVGTHIVEVYATRRNSSPNSGTDSPTALIAIARPAPIASNLNQFMAKAVLQVSGVYNN